MKRIFFIAGIALATWIDVNGQSADEAIRYSELRFGGTARGMGVAGAFGAIGADFSSIISNPGGLALYRKSEVTFSLAFEQINIESLYESTYTDEGRFNVNVPNMSYVHAGKRKNDMHWKYINFGIGYNRLANFNADNYYRSASTNNSILHTYANELTGTPANELQYGGNYSYEAVLGYDSYLINPLPTDNTRYETVVENSDVNQQISMEKRGAIDELSFSVAANYDEKIYFGGYVGIPFLYYREWYLHQEHNTSSDIEAFNYFENTHRQNTFGVGVNFKMGLIARPVDWLRLGAAFHTPTFYGMDDDYSTIIISDFDTIQYFPPEQFNEFHYNLVTPMRFVGSVGFIARKYAFISFDYEWVDYSNAKYKMDSPYTDFEFDLNDDISTQYGSANVYRAGIEWALDKFRLRGGFAHYDSPYENAGFLEDYDASVNYYTGGAGVRFKKVYVDLAYVRSHLKTVNLTVNDELAYDEVKGNKFMVTTGFRF